MHRLVFLVQAYRDNQRIAFQDAEFAKHLWQMSSLSDIFKQIDLEDGQHAVGLNPNIRLYKYIAACSRLVPCHIMPFLQLLALVPSLCSVIVHACAHSI